MIRATLHRIVLATVALLVIAAGSPLIGKAKGSVVEAISIEGLVRVDAEGVLKKVKVPTGKPLDPAVVSGDIKRIYAMGFFEQVKAFAKPTGGGIELVYQVVERPTINKILYTGHDEVDLDDITQEIDLKPLQILNENDIKRNEEKILDVYKGEGFYLAKVTHTLTPAPNNSMDVTFVISEGNELQVKKLIILGNKNVPDENIKQFLQTQEAGYFSFLTESGKFTDENLATDRQIIQEYYGTLGYINATVDEPVVTLSKDKKYIYITIPVTEGPQYTVGEVTVQGDVMWDPESLKESFKLAKGNTFSTLDVRADTMLLNKMYQDEGFANVTISNGHILHEEDNVVDFSYIIQKGKKVYVRKIIVKGNLKTSEKIIRREMKIAEGDLYSATNIERSKARIVRLGFLENVTINTQYTSDPSKVDLVVEVTEKDTGTFQLGFGVSSLENFVFTAQVSKYNFLGRGQTISFQAIRSSIRSILSLSFFEPYFLDTNWTFSINLYDYLQDYDDFTKDSLGGSLGWGYRFTDDFHVSLNYTLEHVETTIGGWSNRTVVPIARLFDTGLTSSVRLTLAYDTRDNVIIPNKGQFTSLSVENADTYLGSENIFTRYIFRTRWYFPLMWGAVFKVNTTAGYITSSSADGIPIFERFFVGGIFTVRGFQRNSLGPQINVAGLGEPGSSLTPFTIGGDKELIFNAEIEFPIVQAVGIKGVIFFDAGNAFGENDPLSFDMLSNLRTSVGFGFRWWSPMGPLRFEWGFPLKPKADEEPYVFEFTIGSGF